MFNKKKELTKEEYWHKWKFFELLDLLDKCEDLINKEFGNGKYEESEIGQLHAELIDEIDSIEFGNKNNLLRIHSLFNGSNPLTQYTAKRNKELLDQIVEITSNWTKNNS